MKTDTQFVAVASLPQDKFGKIKPGQQVFIKLDAYDDVLHGSVARLADNFDAEKGSFTVYMQIPQSAKSYKNGMTGTAEIVVAKKRLIQKFSPF